MPPLIRTGGRADGEARFRGAVPSQGLLGHGGTVPQALRRGAVLLGGRRRTRGSAGPQMKLKSGTPELMPLKSSPLAATSSSGVQAESRVTWPAAWKALMA